MRIGILGLGRIGAFHAADPRRLDASTPSSSPTRRRRPPRAARSGSGAEAVDSPEAAARRRCGRRRHRRRAPTPTPRSSSPRSRRAPGVLREAGRARPSTESRRRAARLADSGVQVQIGYNAPLRRRLRGRAATPSLSGELGRLHTVRSTTLDPAPPPAAYVAASGGHLPRLQRARLRHRPLGHRPRGRRGVRDRLATSGADFIAEAGDVDTAAAHPHPRRRHPRRGLQHPLQRARLRRPPGAARQHRQHRRRPGGPARRCAPSSRAPPSRPDRRTTSSWTASPTAYRAELTAFLRSRRCDRLSVHTCRGARGRLDRRGLHAVAARAPAGAHG